MTWQQFPNSRLRYYVRRRQTGRGERSSQSIQCHASTVCSTGRPTSPAIYIFHFQFDGIFPEGIAIFFINCKGIECAIILYPTSAFTDTGLRHVHKGSSNRIFSIGDSWDRKAMSSVRVYAGCVDLIVFLYGRSLANKFYNAHVLAKERNLTADGFMRHPQVSTGYWDVVQDIAANYYYYYYYYYDY